MFLGCVARFWHPLFGFTSFLVLDSTNDERKIDAFKAQPIFIYRHGGYDGQYYAELAYHPSLRSTELKRALDNPAYRARRILMPALAWLLGLGRPGLIVHVYSVLNVGAWLALAALLWRLLPVRDWRSWMAWAGVLFSAGALWSVRLALMDLVALAILTGAIMSIERGFGLLGALLAAAAGLTRETSLVAAAGLVQRPWLSRKNTGRITLAVVPLLCWMLYVAHIFGANDTGTSNLAVPLGGIADKILTDVATVRALPTVDIAWVALLATVGLLVQAVFLGARRRPDDPWWRAGASYVLLMLVLGQAVWEGFPGAATRVLLPMTLAFNVLAARGGASVAWLLAGNLTVANGLLMLRDVPYDPQELAARRAASIAIVARTGGGWYPIERGAGHTRAWSPWRGSLDLETWPREAHAIPVVASAQSLQPIMLTVAQDGAVLWRSTIFPKPITVSLACRVREGHARLDFIASPLGRPEPPADADGRPIFAIGDLRFGDQ